MKKSFSPIVGGLLGIFWFLIIWGGSTLNITNVDWMKQGDCATHFFGWLFFKNSAWQFPLGMIDGLTEPYPLSIIYTDSIPVFAIIFKILSPILPPIFQYFGIWGLFCLIMEGILAFAIVKYFDGNAFMQVVIGSMVILQPCMITRMFTHTALAGQWIILLALYIWINKTLFYSFKRKIIAWSIVMMLACSIHMYFIPMIAIIMFGSMLQDVLLDRKKIYHSIIIYACACLAGIVVLFVFGAMSGNVHVDADGLGYYCMNLNSLWNPMYWSRIFSSLPLAIDGQYEGLAYLGCGVITACIITVLMQSFAVIHRQGESKTEMALDRKRYIPYIVVVVLLLILALGTVVSLNKTILFTWSYPHIVGALLGIFRSSGRMIWPVCYLIIIGIAYYFTNKAKNKRAGYIILAICLILQIYDISERLIAIHSSTDSNSRSVYSKLEGALWDEISNDEMKHIFLCEEFSDMKPFVNYAVENGMRIVIATVFHPKTTGLASP